MIDPDATRPGEAVLDKMPEPLAHLVCIGTLRTPFLTRADCPHQGDPEGGPDCRAEIAAAFLPALVSLEAPAWLDILYWLGGARRDLLVQNAKGSPRGTFATRSPLRPNPIGLSRVRLLGVDGAVLRMRGLDCLDGTPLLDIKPARCPHGGQD
jgi:tRNA-Thr(GGU) m(6)t(6)A37 methyltransferase TsaA